MATTVYVKSNFLLSKNSFSSRIEKLSSRFFFFTKNKQSRIFKFLTQGKAVFNREISQNGSYTVHVCPTWYFKLGLGQVKL